MRVYADIVHKEKPGCTVCSNWMYTLRQPDDISVPIDYISGDFDWRWSAQTANAEARLIDTKGTKWDLMDWMFTSAGEMNHWTYKTVPALCQEAAIVIACGGALMLYDQPKRDAGLVPWHFDIMADVARFVRVREELCKHTKSVPQVAILHSKHHYYSKAKPCYGFNNAEKPVHGALDCILDNKLHADILTDTDFSARMAEYPLVIIAEQTNLPPEAVRETKEYVFGGGCAIITGEETTRLFDDIMGVSDTGRMLGEAHGHTLALPQGNMEHTLYGQWRAVTCERGSFARIVWGRGGAVPGQTINCPAAVVSSYGKGRIACVYGSIFSAYMDSHYPYIRRFIKDITQRLEIKALTDIEGPQGVHITLREKQNKLIINLINLNSDKPKAPNNEYVEDVPNVGLFRLKVPVPARPASVYLGLGEGAVDWSYENGMVTAGIGSIGIHAIVVIER